MNAKVWLIAALVFVADFVIKTYLRLFFAYQSIPLIKNVLHITVVFNTGAAFGILKGKTQFLIYIGILFIILFIIFMQKERQEKKALLIAYGLIVGGALSNLYDRIFLGYVVDYIDIQIWPVFNLSDACISTGAFLLCIGAIRKKP